MKVSFIVGTILSISNFTEAAIRTQKEFVPTKKIEPVVVAVIDTGADIKHRDLEPLLWKNPGESGTDSKGRDKSTNGIDDDDNGFVDDLHGWNFVDDSNDLSDAMGHGTHIAGVIAKQSGKSLPFNKKSKAGVQLMILKYYDASAGDGQNIKNTIKALHYAIQMRAKIINYSGGGSLPSKEELHALKLAEALNITVVAAAGNNKTNTDLNHYYPANYGLANIISVAASNQDGDLVNFSNWGAKTVDLAAPGHRILSALPGNKYGYMSGTSQATAYVSGNLAALLGSELKLKASDAVQKLIQFANHKRNLLGKTRFQVALVSSSNNEM